jgi:hypothetical protein
MSRRFRQCFGTCCRWHVNGLSVTIWNSRPTLRPRQGSRICEVHLIDGETEHWSIAVVDNKDRDTSWAERVR